MKMNRSFSTCTARALGFNGSRADGGEGGDEGDDGLADDDTSDNEDAPEASASAASASDASAPDYDPRAPLTSSSAAASGQCVDSKRGAQGYMAGVNQPGVSYQV